MAEKSHPRIKICGIKDHVNLQAACDAGADFIGFVFYPPSPRDIAPVQAADLIRQIKTGIKAVGLFVDPSDADLDTVLEKTPLDMIQLHGAETPARVQEIKQRAGLKIIKAIPVRNAQDVQAAYAYEDRADWLLFDAKPVGETLPGGTGKRFDWSYVKDKNFKKPWMLSGGLDENTVKQALNMLVPDAVDVSSGVESQRGQKDPQKITNFIKAVKSNDYC